MAPVERSADARAWEQRYRVTMATLPSWSRQAPDRLVYVSNEGGSYQTYGWDAATGERERVSDEEVGILIESRVDPTPDVDGSSIVWFHDPTGDESGRWMIRAFHGGSARPLLFGVPDGWPSGLALGRRVIVAAIADGEGFALYSSADGGDAGEVARGADLLEISRPQWGGFNVAGLSRDEDLLCVEHAGHGDNLHLALRVIDPVSGDVVGEQWDGDGYGLFGEAWSPVPGDRRLAIRQERGGWWRPAIWDLATGERRDLDLRVDGEVETLDWWPDGSALLVSVMHEGRTRLYKCDVASCELTPVEHPEGVVLGAQVRPDGEVWLRHQSSVGPSRILSTSGEDPLPQSEAELPESQPFRSWRFDRGGQSVHGFYVTPPGEGPFPLVMQVHGGPEWLWADEWHPQVQALVDRGFAVALVNYRGSTGYGRDWRDSLIRNVGFFEVEDCLAGIDDLVARGIADPSRVVLAGKSWGGYITLLGIGMHPSRWIAAVADVPVGDYVMAYVDSAPALQAWDRSLCGGAPPDIPDFIAPRSPITYVERVSTPVLVLVGENDSRCPPRQVHHYVDRLAAAGGDAEVYSYETGHSSYVVDEEVRQTAAVLDFLERRVPRP